MKGKKIRKEIEYEEAPCGYVSFYNYKEPLMRYEGGYGFVGALVFDGESDRVQCHLCGEWFKYLPSHLAKEHNMKSAQYKEEVGLLRTTALISESLREKLILRGLGKRIRNLKSRKGKGHTEEAKMRISRTLRENATKDEYVNLKGTCPAQLIDRIQRMYREDPKNWRIKKLEGMRLSINRVYGSVRKACQIAGVPYLESGRNWTSRKVHTEEGMVAYVRQFLIAYGRNPTREDMVAAGHKVLYQQVARNRKGLERIVRKTHDGMEEYVKTDLNVRYSDAQLLAFLRRFERINKRRPSYSDCKRGLIPPLSTYSRRFKGFNNALIRAFEQGNEKKNG